MTCVPDSVAKPNNPWILRISRPLPTTTREYWSRKTVIIAAWNFTLSSVVLQLRSFRCHTTECKGQREPPCQEQAAAIAGRLSMPAKRNSFIAETLFPDLDANAGFVSHSFS